MRFIGIAALHLTFTILQLKVGIFPMKTCGLSRSPFSSFLVVIVYYWLAGGGALCVLLLMASSWERILAAIKDSVM